ncbi:MAG TPA: RluA family pseudouridine synthase [Vicinamibacterales bacterium]|nr:RluA family pseudouridine synthase [Vicinamibacterales bacterium]HOQ60858.1 RluA family pseudouridine synthase [Vicinamibacterales bacterium]HPK72521.1 RluA family pseudouridine synthase [Vicinamibacterales bacterium]
MVHYEFRVEGEEAGQRLDHFLVSKLNGPSRSQVQRLIKDGLVAVGGRGSKANYTVRAGDAVAADLPDPAPAAPQPEALPLDVLFEDADVIVVNKAAGMVVHPAPGHASGTLVNALLHHVDDLSGVGGELRPGIVHRLDRGTSGVMVVAKHDASHRELARQFHDREVEKEYEALVWGLVQQGRRIDAAIGRDPRDRTKMSHRARYARSAATRVTLARFLNGVSYLRVVIATGRTHQIRVHLSGIGHPIVGDTVYGGVRKQMPARLRPVLRLERPFLHARRLAFTHPADAARRLEFTAPLPADLQAVLDELEAHARAGGT